MIPNQRMIFWSFAGLVFVALTGCYPGYRMDVEQGNIVTSEQIKQLQLGMTHKEARFVLGTPLVKDPFHANRWDYVYSLRDGSTGALDKQRLSLFFQDRLLVDIRYESRGAEIENINPKPPEEVTRHSFLQRLWNRIRAAD